MEPLERFKGVNFWNVNIRTLFCVYLINFLLDFEKSFTLFMVLELSSLSVFNLCLFV